MPSIGRVVGFFYFIVSQYFIQLYRNHTE